MLYAFGSNGSGQLGLCDKIDRSNPEQCVFPLQYRSETTVSVASGGNHTFVLLQSGRVLSTGSNEKGQRGPSFGERASHGFSDISIYSDEDKLELFKACSATWEASTLVSLADAIYTFGAGPKGELGQGEAIIASAPRRLSGFPPGGSTVIDISSCMGHTAVVLSNGDVYGWGQGRKGQLGAPTGIVWSPRRIPGLPFKAVRAVCGKDFTYIVGPADTGQHMLLGPDNWNIRSGAPDRVRGWKDVRSSWGSIFVLLCDGTLISWGRNDCGQLPATTPPELRKIAAGSEHCLGLTTQGEVLAWGWGEHGNCGLSVEAERTTQTTWNTVDMDNGRGICVTGIGAGCATSWILAEP